MQCFTVSSNEIENVLSVEFYSPLFLENRKKIRSSKLQLVKLQDITTKITKGETPLWKGDRYQEQGVLFIKSENVLENELNLSSKTFIGFGVHERMNRSQLRRGDVLLNIVGASIGRSCVYDIDEEANINQAVCLIRPNKDINSHWLSLVLNSKPFQTFVNQIKSGGARDNIDLYQVRELQIPLQPLSIQSQVVEIMQSAYNQKKHKDAEAQRLLDSIDDYVLDELGIKLPEVEDKMCFVVDAEELGGILSPHFFISKPKDVKGFVELKSIAEINPTRKENYLKLDAPVPYVGLPETDNFKVKNILERPYKEVRGRNIIKKGDILFARIEPSIFNKKYIVVDDLRGYDYAFTSTEFYIVKAGKNVNPEFLFYMFYTTPVYNQVIGKTTGSTGRRRLDKGVFEALLIPFPSLEIQNKIADEVKRRISEAERLKAEASRIIEEAKKKVEDMILGD